MGVVLGVAVGFAVEEGALQVRNLGARRADDVAVPRRHGCGAAADTWLGQGGCEVGVR